MVGYLLEELRSESNYEMFKKDISDANIFIASLIFIEELADKVKAAVEPERERLDAILVFPSMPTVMRLNKLGTFSMAQLGQSKSAVASFMKKKRAESGSGFEDGLLKLIRTLPKVRSKVWAIDVQCRLLTFLCKQVCWIVSCMNEVLSLRIYLDSIAM